LDVWVVLRRYVPVGRGVEGVELIKVEARKPRPRRGGDGVPVNRRSDTDLIFFFFFFLNV